MACFLLAVGVVLGISLMLLDEPIFPISTELRKPYMLDLDAHDFVLTFQSYMLDLDAHDFALTSQITLVLEHSASVVNHPVSVVLSSFGAKYHI